MEALEGLHAWRVASPPHARNLALTIVFFSLLAPLAGARASNILVRRRHVIESRRALAEVIHQSQVWCVASAGASNDALQNGLDWACGSGNISCSAIQPSGSCYTPQNLQNHASYAYNEYYQKENQNPAACNFSGSAIITSINPSIGSCIFPSISSELLNSTTPSASSPTTIFNPNSSHASHLLRPPRFFYNSPHALCGMLVALLICSGA